MSRESLIVSRFLREVEALRRAGRPVWAVKLHGSQFGKAGAPDVLLCNAGRFVALEFKRAGEMPTAIQTHQGRQINAAGGAWLTVYGWREALFFCGLGPQPTAKTS